MKNEHKPKLIFGAIVLLGVLLRLWKFDSLPNGLDGDVIISATNSLHIFNGEDFRVFQNNKIVGHPVAYLFWCMPLGFFLIAVFTNIFKNVELGTLKQVPTVFLNRKRGQSNISLKEIFNALCAPIRIRLNQ